MICIVVVVLKMEDVTKKSQMHHLIKGLNSNKNNRGNSCRQSLHNVGHFFVLIKLKLERNSCTNRCSHPSAKWRLSLHVQNEMKRREKEKTTRMSMNKQQCYIRNDTPIVSETTSEAFEILDPIRFLQSNDCVRQIQFDTCSVDSFIARRNSDSILFKPLRLCT